MASSQKQNCKPDVLLVKCMCSVQILPAGFGLGMYIQKKREGLLERVGGLL